VSLISDYINDEDRTNMTCLIVRINFSTSVCSCARVLILGFSLLHAVINPRTCLM
jgi:hypothetical protein